MTRTSKWPIILATLPLWGIFWLLSAVVVARARLGTWPIYNQPDPSNVLPILIDVPVLPLILLAPFACLASLMVGFHGWYVGRDGWKNVVLVAVGSFLVLVGWLWVDPGGFFNWWSD